MKPQSHTLRLFNNSRTKSNLTFTKTAATALLSLTACSGEGAWAQAGGAQLSDGEIVETATQSEALFNYAMTEEFKTIAPVTALATDVGDPGICTPEGAHSKIIFTRDTSNFIQGISDVIGIGGNWAKYGGAGSTRQLGGRPACGFLSSASNPYPFVILAKGLSNNGVGDKRLFWSRGNWNATGAAPAPSAVTAWTQISNTQFSTNGNPAVAAKNGQLVVVYLGDNGQVLGNYWITANNAFSGTVTGPTLPAGWTGTGTPAIHFAESWSGRFTVVVRATNAQGASRFYITFFGSTSFEGAVPGSGAAYSQVILPAGAPAIQSDPAYEFDNDPVMNSATLYYRNSNTLYQVSAPNNVYGFEQSVIEPITVSGATPNITGNPVAVGGVPYEAGKHWLLARGNNEIYFFESYNDGVHLIADRAGCADGNVPEEIFGDGHMVGCAGSVTWGNRATLCAAGSSPCSAGAWHALQQSWGPSPAHHYWTNDDLRWSGSGSGACFVSTSVGNTCTGQPMRVCSGSSTTDPEGNVCNWINCGYGSTTPNEYFGGCSGNNTAGTLCCR